MTRSDVQTCLGLVSGGEGFHRREGKVLRINDMNALKHSNSFYKVNPTFMTLIALQKVTDN
jgi:hypothetical protein